MENLLHYVWQHQLFPLAPLTTVNGQHIEVIDPGLHNNNAGPDFFNAKVKIDDTLWVGNVEIHERASDWYRHQHQHDPHYDNVILHVVGNADLQVTTSKGEILPQLILKIPPQIQANYQDLLAEEAYPPCYKVIPNIAPIYIRSWMSALTTERLEDKTQRIQHWLQTTGGDWEHTFFITLARNFGFGTNADAFETWAVHLPLSAVAKHRDDIFQIEAIFFGQAGLLDNRYVDEAHRDTYFLQLQKEYAFLSHKFSLTPMNAHLWKFLRMRPQNFPHVRLSQLAQLYFAQKTKFSDLLEARSFEQLSRLFEVCATPYWENHFLFGEESIHLNKTLQTASRNLILINTVAPLLFAYGKHTMDENRCEWAFDMLEHLPAEQNHILRSWGKAGIKATSAADSQALIQLRRNYCDKKDCLRCRFGCEYLKRH